MSRISKRKYYLQIAEAVAFRSPCLRRQIGALIVKDDCIISTGYNGPPRGSSHCEVCIRESNNVPHGAEYKGCPAVHAEENVIINAARYGVSILGGVMYITGIEKDGTIISVQPCYRCSRALQNAGIVKIVTR